MSLRCHKHPDYNGSVPTTAAPSWAKCDGCKEVRREFLLFDVPDPRDALAVEAFKSARVTYAPDDTTNPKDIVGDRKPPLWLVPASATIYESKVFALGAKKYGPYNWRQKKVRATVYLAAALRHLLTALDGEDIDPESLQHHVAHARACTGIYLDAIATGNLIDDRPVKGAAAKLIEEMTEKEKANGE